MLSRRFLRPHGVGVRGRKNSDHPWIRKFWPTSHATGVLWRQIIMRGANHRTLGGNPVWDTTEMGQSQVLNVKGAIMAKG